MSLRRGRPWLRYLILLVLPILWLSTAQARLLFYESFDYPMGNKLGQASFTGPAWENHKDQFIIVPGSLDYPGLQAPSGNRLNIAATSPSLDSVRTAFGAWPCQSNGTLYVSFLLRIQSPDRIDSVGDGTPVLTIGRTSNHTELFGINLLSNKGCVQLGVLKYPSNDFRVSSAFFSSGAGANLSADGSTTYLIVAKYEWLAGATNDVVSAWVNPDGIGVSEDAAAKVFTSAGPDGAGTAGRLTLCRGPHLNIDEIRIGQTWAEVTPQRSPRQNENVSLPEKSNRPAKSINIQL